MGHGRAYGGAGPEAIVGGSTDGRPQPGSHERTLNGMMSDKGHGYFDRKRPRRRLSVVVAVFVEMCLLVGAARAHGGGTLQVSNEDIGPYWVSVWTSPDPVREGQMHITVSVAEPGAVEGEQAGAPILGAKVDISLTPRAGGFADIHARATNEQSANKLFYEADLAVPASGDWQVQVDVQGPAGEGQVGFNIAVLPAQSTDWLLVGGVAFLGISALFFFYAMRSDHSRNDD